MCQRTRGGEEGWGPRGPGQAAGSRCEASFRSACPGLACPSEGVLILLPTLSGTHDLQHFPPGLSKDSPLLSPKRALS